MIPLIFGDEASQQQFELSENFLNDYATTEPDMTPLGYTVYKRTYAREIDGEDRTEEWWETVRRVVEGTFTVQKRHCVDNNLPWDEAKARKSARKMYDLIFNFKFTPPGRGLWMMGTDYIFERETNAPLMNCAFRSTKDIDEDFASPFSFMADMSMLGVGVGSDTRGKGSVEIKDPVVDESWTYTVPDSREGWVESIEILLNGYGHGETIPSEFDYSEIREKGEPLEGFGGTASGPQPLIDLHENIHKLLEPMIGDEIDAETIVDLHNLVGKCVVAGGIRRTAQIMFGDPDNEDYLRLKDPDSQSDFWGEPELRHHRWASNNSVFADVGMEYDDATEFTKKNGEPGFIWLENARTKGRMKDPKDTDDRRVLGSNPCGEQLLEDGELCNLVETYPVNHDSLEEWKETLKYAYMYAKTVTLLPNHNERSNSIMMRNRRIGCSISGITQAFQKFGRREVLEAMDEGYDRVQDWDETYSDWLCIPESVRTTTVKPSGTVSRLADVTSGIHYEISKYYIRNVRFQDTSPILEQLKDAGFPVEEDMSSDDTMVVSFPMKKEHIERGESDVSMWEQLENVAQVQKYWSDNSVSCTIKFDPETEAEDIPKALSLFEDRLKTVSFLPNEKDVYEQAPYIPISKEEYEKRKSEIGEIDLTGDTHEKEDKFCQGETCEIDPVDG